MKVAEVRKLIGQKVSVQKRYSGITDCGVILSVKGRNIEVDFWGMTDWLWLPDVHIVPITTPEDAEA